MLNVYDTLKASGYKTEICAAGGLHSIFGTNAFKKAMLRWDQKQIVVNLIGLEATKYVELFHTVKRPQTLENALKNNTLEVELNSGATKTLTQIELNILCAIEAANLSDQKSLKNYPLIAKFLRKNK